MSARCEPPEELRGVDGWHWLAHPRWGEWPTRYLAACHPGIWPLWCCPESNWTTPAAHREGWRYIAPVTPPAEVDALRAEASEWCQKAQLFEDRIHKLSAELAAAREALRQIANHPGATWNTSTTGRIGNSVAGQLSRKKPAPR